MSDTVTTVLGITRGLRKAQGLAELSPGARASFARDLDRLDAALTNQRYGYSAHEDPYAQALDVSDLEARLRGAPPPASPPAAPTSPPPPA
ncbi:MAG: hypothetical protein ABI678_13495, partial [Kofleriaceae bacterium]